MKRPQLVPQGSIDRMHKAADEAWTAGQHQQAIELLERANRLAPANIQVLTELGRLYGLHHDYSAAERCFEKALQLSPEKTKTLIDIGERARAFVQQELAERYLKKAAAQPDATAEVCVQLAELCELQRRMDEARALVGRALQINSVSSDALIAHARHLQQTGQLDQAEATLRAVLNQPDPGAKESRPRDSRIRAWYELGAILDRQRRFDDAMAAFLQAKSMLRLHAGPHLANLHASRAYFRQFRDRLTADVLQRWANFGRQHLGTPRRIALLGGHPRSGTTLLEQVLDSHPDIVSAEESTIFHDEVHQPMTRVKPTDEAGFAAVLRQARDTYFRSMERFLGQPIGDRLLIDKNPSNTFLIPNLAQVFPAMKFLIALRDPRDVCISIFTQGFPLRMATSAYLSLESTVDEYVELMSMWTKVGPLLKNPSLEIRYEDLVQDLESVSRRVLDFLGVPWNEEVLRFNEHARQKMVRTPTYADVIKPVFKSAMGRWRNYQKYLEPHLPKLEPFVRKFGYE